MYVQQYGQQPHNIRSMVQNISYTVNQHKDYIDQLVNNFNQYWNTLSYQQLNEIVGKVTQTNNGLKSQIGHIEQLIHQANMIGDNEAMFQANNIRSLVLGIDRVANDFIGHIYKVMDSANANLQQLMAIQNGFQMGPQQMFLAQHNATVNNNMFNGFGQQVNDSKDTLMISSRTNPAGWNASNMSSGSSLDVYDNNDSDNKVNTTTSTRVNTVNNSFTHPEGFKNEFEAFTGADDLDQLLKTYGIGTESIDVSELPETNKNNEDIIPGLIESEEATNSEVERLKEEINKLKEELKMERGMRDDVVDISFNEFLLDQDNKSMSASYRPNGLKLMVQVGELPKPYEKDIETCEYSVSDDLTNKTTLTYNNLIESSLRRTQLAEALLGEVDQDRILICSDFMSAIINLVSDRVYTHEENNRTRKNAEDFVQMFSIFQKDIGTCKTLVDIYDAIESLSCNEFGKRVTEYFKVVLKDELNDFFRYSIETVAGNLIKGELDRETAEVINFRSTSTPVAGGWLDTLGARRVYASFIENIKDLFKNFFSVVDIADDDLPMADTNTIPVQDKGVSEYDEKSVSVYLRVKTRTFGIRFDNDLDKITNGKQVQGVVTRESNPKLHNILDHCVTDPEVKRSTLCRTDYVPGNNHIMICANPGINISYRIYPRYDVKGDAVIRKGFFIKMMSSY